MAARPARKKERPVILFALGSVLVVEGLIYALAPALVERMLAALAALTPQQRRLAGALCVVLGLALIRLAGMTGL